MPYVWLENGVLICLTHMISWVSAETFPLSPSISCCSFFSSGIFVCQQFNHRPVYHCQELKGVKVFGVVEGGDILEERVRSARETAKRPVAGFCLDGLQTGSMEQALRTQLITAVTKELPEDKPRSALLMLA